MNLNKVIRVALAVITGVLLTGQLALAASGTNTFTEDFLSTTNRDTVNTTAAWGDGSSFLHPSLTGVCNQSGPRLPKMPPVILYLPGRLAQRDGSRVYVQVQPGRS